MSDRKEEKSIIFSFYERERRDELLSLSNKESSREAFVEAMLNTKDLEDSCIKKIPPGENLPEKISMLLSGLGAPPSCYVISENEELDGKQCNLKTALEELVESGDGGILSCIPGRLAYFEGCSIDEHLLLKK